jgi:hypothetical protein
MGEMGMHALANFIAGDTQKTCGKLEGNVTLHLGEYDTRLWDELIWLSGEVCHETDEVSSARNEGHFLTGQRNAGTGEEQRKDAMNM